MSYCDCDTAKGLDMMDRMICHTLITYGGERTFDKRDFVTTCPYCNRVLEGVSRP